MESAIVLYMTKLIHQDQDYASCLFMEHLMSDDDSNMLSLLQYKDSHEKRQLLDDIPEFMFLADPNHRIKVMAKPIFKLVTKKRSK